MGVCRETSTNGVRCTGPTSESPAALLIKEDLVVKIKQALAEDLVEYLRDSLAGLEDFKDYPRYAKVMAAYESAIRELNEAIKEAEETRVRCYKCGSLLVTKSPYCPNIICEGV